VFTGKSVAQQLKSWEKKYYVTFFIFPFSFALTAFLLNRWALA